MPVNKTPVQDTMLRITDLHEDIPYMFRVRAENEEGLGDSSPSTDEIFCRDVIGMFYPSHVRIQRGDRESGPPLENNKNIGFLSNTDPDPLKITKLPIQQSSWAIIGPPAIRHLNGVLLAVRRWPTNSGIWILPPLIKLKKKHCQSWTPSDKTFWIRASFLRLSSQLLSGQLSGLTPFKTIVVWSILQTTP